MTQTIDQIIADQTDAYMTSLNAHTCDKCGAAMVILHPYNPVHEKCESCGHEITYIFNPVFPSLPPEVTEEVTLICMIEKAQEINGDFAKKLHSLIPEEDKNTITSLYKQLRNSSDEFIVGTYPKFRALDIVRAGENLGISFVIKKV